MSRDVNPMKGQCKHAALLRRLVLEAVGQFPSSVLELGCGPGGNLAAFPEAEIRVGIDPGEANCAEFDPSSSGQFIRGDHRKLREIKTNQFEVGFTCSVLDHIEDMVPALVEMLRVCKTCVFVEPMLPGPPRQAMPGETSIWNATWYHRYDIALQMLHLPHEIAAYPLSKTGSGPHYVAITIPCETFGQGEELRPLVVMSRPERYNKGLHGGFLDSLSRIGGSPMFYGPVLGGVPEEHRLAFCPGAQMEEIAEEVGANCVLVYRGNRKDMDWLPQSFQRPAHRPFLWVDVDFCYLRDEAKKDHARFSDLHLLRNPSDLAYSAATRKEILPHSIDPVAYSYAPMGVRKQIGFSGQSYATRKVACQATGATVLRERVSPQKQGDFYRTMMAGITCRNGDIRYLNAKHFEIPATGAILFTDGVNGIEDYLPEGTYIRYSEGAANIAAVWKVVQTHREEWARKTARAATEVHAHHTHYARWAQLLAEVNRCFGTDYRLGTKGPK